MSAIEAVRRSVLVLGALTFASPRFSIAGDFCDIAAFVWPAYQPEPRWAELGIFKDGKGEWQNVTESVKRYADDLSELRPHWGFENEADPKVVERKIDTATKYGVNVFIYDWYWYGGRPFLADALEKGFLGARNNQKMKFFVMWANHNVTRLWDNRVGRAHKKDVVWPSDVSDEDYAKIVETWIGYFKKPNYYRIDGKPVLCIYLEPRFLVRGEDVAKARIAHLRRRAAEEGFPGVHLMANGWPRADLGYDSMTMYNWGFAGAGDRIDSKTAPALDYDTFAEIAFAQMDKDLDYARQKGIAFFPNLTIGWDNNSRFPASETNNIVHGTSPESFERAARRIKEWMEVRQDAKAPRLLTVNSWNEWTEGSYLEPSDGLGFSFLETLRRVFGEPMRVSVDGWPLKVEEARCSAVRKNQRWPGHQRPKSQTEICSFVRFDLSAPRTVEVTVPYDFERVVVKPLSKDVAVDREGRTVRFTLSRPGGYSVEFDGHHENLHVFADPPANYRVSREDPNVRWFGPGEHDVGPMSMKSGETIYLEEGAVVYGRIFARDASDIRILGRGILDASRVKEEYIRHDPARDAEERAKKVAVANVRRYDTIRLEFCDRVLIDGITIRDSQIYNIRPIGCRDIEIGWVKTVGNWRYNSDGFDFHNCERVRVHDSFIRTFDDAICIKGWDCWMDESEMSHNGHRYDRFSDVRVERCTIWNDWGKGLEIGAETRAEEICGVVFRDCDIIRTSGAALDIFNVDYADVHDVVFDDIRVEFDPEPTGNQLVSLLVQQHPEYSAGGVRRGRIRDVLFRNVRVTGPHMPKSGMRGVSDEHGVRGVTFEGVSFNGNPVKDVQELNLSVGEFADKPVVRAHVPDDAEKYGSTDMNRTKACAVSDDAGEVRVLVLGNSIALHGVAPKIGWTNLWGMAASSREKDFAHLVWRGIESRLGKRVACRIQNVYEIEKGYLSGVDLADVLKDVVSWRPDYVIVALGENVAAFSTSSDEALWTRTLVRVGEAFRTVHPQAKIVYRTPFWPNEAKRRATCAAATTLGAAIADLEDRGDDPLMQAVNRGFSHKGVAHHPGDAGMQMIAERILSALFPAERITVSHPPYGERAEFGQTLADGVRVKGRICGSYLFPSGIVTELSVDVPAPRPGRSIELRLERRMLVKLLSELPNGWSSRFEREDCVLTIPIDRSCRSYPEEAVLPVPRDVPDLLTSEAGRRISTREEWESVRRPEIRRFFRDRVYGRRPCERPPYLKFDSIGPDCVMMDGAAVRKRVRVTYGGAYATNSFAFTAFIPQEAKKPVASFLLICNRDPKKNIDPDRREKSGFWPAEEIVRRGFAALAFYNGDVAPDYVHGNTVGVFTAFEDVTRRYRDQNAWGLISCWGWGASRVLDWIETEPTLDARRVAVVGHSRGGKTALVAAAMDERFAMACVNDSGCCGMKLNHIDLPASERPLHTIRNRQNWYCLDFTEFANREREMPYDMHALAALIAPRKLCVASASDDSEAGPVGEFWSARLASPAWELYGKRGLVSSDAFPSVGHPLQEGRISYHVRRGGHDLTAYDWSVYMDFLEHE